MLWCVSTILSFFVASEHIYQNLRPGNRAMQFLICLAIDRRTNNTSSDVHQTYTQTVEHCWNWTVKLKSEDKQAKKKKVLFSLLMIFHYDRQYFAVKKKKKPKKKIWN